MELGHPAGSGLSAKRGFWAGLLTARDHGNPGAVPASHQNAILGLAEIGDAHGEPDSDRRQRDREGQRGDIGQHAVTEVLRLVSPPFVAGQVVRYRLAKGLVASLVASLVAVTR